MNMTIYTYTHTHVFAQPGWANRKGVHAYTSKQTIIIQAIIQSYH